jgi:hypothetical protein
MFNRHSKYLARIVPEAFKRENIFSILLIGNTLRSEKMPVALMISFLLLIGFSVSDLLHALRVCRRASAGLGMTS